MEHCSLCFTHPIPFLLCTSKQVHKVTKIYNHLQDMRPEDGTEDGSLEYVQ